MFGFFKEKKDNLGSIEDVERHLQLMGYDLLPYGAVVAQAELMSGYGAVEAASHIALTTLALDVKETGNDVIMLTALMTHGAALAKHLKKLNDAGDMPNAQYQNDVQAVLGIMNPSPEQIKWVDKVLEDPIAGKERLATSRIDYLAESGRQQE